MPKKFAGENSKAVAARDRKASAKSESEQKKKKQLEDEAWKDDDKHVARKQNRKEEAERKKHEQQLKKQEKDALLRQEEEQLTRHTVAKQPTAKITRSQVNIERERIAENARRANSGASATNSAQKPGAVLQPPTPLQENINRLTCDGEEARSVTEAIAVLSVSGSGATPEPDRHPERRMRAAYRTFEDDMLPKVRQENPGMRLTQLKQLVHKEWDRSDRNPMNQAHVAYNTK